MQLHATGISIAAITGGNVGNWQRALAYNSGTYVLHYEVWWGVATATGSAGVDITYSASVNSYPIELIADSFTTATALPWSVVATGGTSGGSSATVTWPTLSSGLEADQLYWGASEEEATGTGGSTPGFTYDATGNGNRFLFNGYLAEDTAYAPTCDESPAGVSTAVGVIFAAGGGTAVTITGTNFASGDTVSFGGVAATGVTITSATSITAFAPAESVSTPGGTVDVTVTGPAGTSAISPSDEFTYTFANAGWTISISASNTAPSIGDSVILTATANQDVGPPYGMSIVDASTGVIVAQVGSGATTTTVVKQSSALTQRYVAEIDDTGGLNIQAVSSPVIVTWG
jgi:hypothetical protein